MQNKSKQKQIQRNYGKLNLLLSVVCQWVAAMKHCLVYLHTIRVCSHQTGLIEDRWLLIGQQVSHLEVNLRSPSYGGGDTSEEECSMWF